eukprot:CAMPEP_0181484882 /NCGR_PEP_ID=MMETSP1110-20121109/46246_1 /TAXON_ID=174948 /ORGANISM="Symbiodinium sp., Strain CCMP421" /LENGTH=76 /DNA_ID=CAMNT_0023610799 /DNA_START=82 /DNA_END=312 /DNA_ORIENTATION=+
MGLFCVAETPGLVGHLGQPAWEATEPATGRGEFVPPGSLGGTKTRPQCTAARGFLRLRVAERACGGMWPPSCQIPV